MSIKIVMYHYVRDLHRTRYPNVKGCDLPKFREQLDYIASRHTVVTVEQVVAALKGGESLPDNSVWLTFDDGFSDHYANVFPLLHERGWQGSFFPTVRANQDRQLLDVHRIHFILAVESDPGLIIAAIRSFIDDHQGCDALRPFAEYWDELAQRSCVDIAE